MLPALLGLSLSSLLTWAGPPPLPESGPAADPGPSTLPAEPAELVPAAEPAEPAELVPAAEPAEPAELVPVAEPAEPDAVGPAERPRSESSVSSPGLAPRMDPEPESDLEGAPGLGIPPGYVTIEPPSWRGTGMLVGAGLTFATALTFQAIDSFVCFNCASGGLERAMMATTIGLAAGGGAVRAHADAYDDTALGRRRPNTRRALVTGAALAGVGAIMGLVNEGLWWRCVVGGDGPYREEELTFQAFDCRYGISRGLLDLSTGAVSTGAALMTWALVYRRDARAYERARVIGLRPTVSRERWGLSLEGRF